MPPLQRQRPGTQALLTDIVLFARVLLVRGYGCQPMDGETQRLCLQNVNFGCAADGQSVWVQGKCHGEFECGGGSVACRGQDANAPTNCSCVHNSGLAPFNSMNLRGVGMLQHRGHISTAKTERLVAELHQLQQTNSSLAEWAQRARTQLNSQKQKLQAAERRRQAAEAEVAALRVGHEMELERRRIELSEARARAVRFRQQLHVQVASLYNRFPVEEEPPKVAPAEAEQNGKKTVCVFDGAVWARRVYQQNVFDFAGKHYFRVRRDPEVLAHPKAVWHDDTAILSWLSCEQNLNHFIGETLGPVWRAMKEHRLNTSHVIITSPALWPHPTPNECVGNRWSWLLTLMPIRPYVYIARTHNESRDFYGRFPPSTMFDAESQMSWPLTVPHCFRRAVVQSAQHNSLGADFYAYLATRSGVCNAGSGYTLFIQRGATRRITNQDEVVQALRRRFELPVVVVRLEKLTVQEQMAVACGARVVLGVQGMGLEWAHFMNGGSSSGLLIEVYWNGWPPYYKSAMRTSGIWGENVQATPMGLAHPKLDNVTVNATYIEGIHWPGNRMRSRRPNAFRGMDEILPMAASYKRALMQVAY